MNRFRTVLWLTFLGLSTAFGQAEEKTGDLVCLTEQQQQNASLEAYWKQRAYAALDRRTLAVEALSTAGDVARYQQRLRDLMIDSLGGLPERTPLNARAVSTIQADGYRIENVLFESQPGHHVTANLYLPDSDSPVPGVVVASGHSRTGKTADYNQRFGIHLARLGMAVLCYDPIGQGERSQILDDDGKPKFDSTTTEHFLIGVGSILVGRNTARYRLWDAIRAIDYLASRAEVDSDRIGFTGCSGGGTLTSYVMAIDDRVACAAPACYLTTFRKLIDTIGPQDAEQNIFGQLAAGLDQPDYVLMRAPRPTLISSTTDDFFAIEGSWDNFRQAKRVYGILGYPERVDLVEVAGGHGVQPQNLATICHWMNRWLADSDRPVEVVELPTRPEEELLCTATGQVLTALADEHSVFQLNASYAREVLTRNRAEIWNTTPAGDLRRRIAECLGMPEDWTEEMPELTDLGRVAGDGFHIDKLVLSTSHDSLLPALTFHPPAPSDDAYLYLHESGKLGGAGPDGMIRRLVDENHVVVAVDLRGQGETGAATTDPLLTDWKTYFLGYLLGQSLVGARTQDALAAARFVAHYEKPPDSPRQVHLVGEGRSGIIALHAAALRPELFASVTVRNTPHDWTTIVEQPVPAGQLENAVHGALTLYDLPDLVQLIGPDKVVFQP